MVESATPLESSQLDIRYPSGYFTVSMGSGSMSIALLLVHSLALLPGSCTTKMATGAITCNNHVWSLGYVKGLSRFTPRS